MPDLNKIPARQQIVFVDYKPAELHINKEWIIRYYAKNPLTNKLQLFRLRAPSMSNKRERQRHAARIIDGINRKLADGWSPFLESGINSFKTFKECKEKFIELTEKEIRDGIKRADTLRTYKSFISMIDNYIKDKNVKITFVLEFNKNFVFNYLDWIYFERSNSPRTYNNHMLFIRTFCNFLIERGYIKENPTAMIAKKRVNPKKRQVITPKIKKMLATKLPAYNYHYYVLAMVTYYCMVRRTEATKLKVSHVNLDQDYIFIPAEISKNKKDEYVTIPEQLKMLLRRHIEAANANDYLYSNDNYKPGTNPVKPKKISDTWTVIQNKFNIPKEFQFYSLKDTGITDLFSLGISPLKIRDQARHYDLSITEMYTQRSKGGDTEIKNSGANFV